MTDNPVSDNPVLAAAEAYRRAHPRLADAVDEAMARGPEEDSEEDSRQPAASSGPDPATSSEQLALDEEDLERVFDEVDWPTEHVGPEPERTIREAFLRFHRENPHVYKQLVAMAWQAKTAGAKKIGIGMMFETLRWQALLRTGGDTFKLNNNYRSYYARLIMAHNPALDGIFELRRLHGRGLSQDDVDEAA